MITPWWVWITMIIPWHSMIVMFDHGCQLFSSKTFSQHNSQTFHPQHNSQTFQHENYNFLCWQEISYLIETTKYFFLFLIFAMNPQSFLATPWCTSRTGLRLIVDWISNIFLISSRLLHNINKVDIIWAIRNIFFSTRGVRNCECLNWHVKTFVSASENG